jgi:hypothetical protein
MSSFPTNGDYVQALQNTDICFSDPVIKGGRVELTPLGMPKAISGNFASVFAITSATGKRYAVKCFTREVKGQHRRYQAIHDTLASLERPWRVGFDYIGHGVLVDGKWRAILRMEWVENSQTLIPWLESNLRNPDKILDVAKQFASCIEDLREAGIAHGDLQHGNLLVDSHQRLRVIDYDGMFVPSIKDLGSNELGLANYQHPGRSGNDFDAELDRFSAWIIYGSLLSLAAQPLLWSTFRNTGDEKLLFSKDDYLPPLNALERMRSLGSPHSEFLDVLNESLSPSSTISSVPRFDPRRLSLPTDGEPKPQNHSFSTDWWREQVHASELSETNQTVHATPPSTDWLKTHAPPLPPIDVEGPSRSAKALALVVSAIAILGATTLTAGSHVLLAGVVLLTWAAAMSAAARGLWLRSETLAGRATARRDLTMAGREVAEQKAEVSRRRASRTVLDRAERKDLQALEDQRAKLPQASRSEVETQCKALRTQLTTLQSALNKIDAGKAAETSKRLKELQELNVQAYLRSCQIEPGVIAGIGESLITALAVHGLRTAADFAGFNDTQFRRTGSTYWFTVSGIGPAKSNAIRYWYQQRLNVAQSRVHHTLPSHQIQAIDNMFTVQKRQQQASIDALTQQLQGVKAAVEMKYTTQDREITQKAEAVRQDYKQRRSASDAAANQAEVELQRRESCLFEAQRNLARYEKVSFSAYLKS